MVCDFETTCLQAYHVCSLMLEEELNPPEICMNLTSSGFNVHVVSLSSLIPYFSIF